jgi:lipoprotein-releasing system permease protein
MSFSLSLALRYLSSRKRAFISISTLFAILGVALGTAALAVVMSVTGGFRNEFRDKVLGVNAHVLVLKYSSEFRDYREVMDRVATLPEVVGVGPFVISPMMLSHAGRTVTGVLLKGVDPERMPTVLDLPRHMTEGSLSGLGAVPHAPNAAPERRSDNSSGAIDAPPVDEAADLLQLLRDLREAPSPASVRKAAKATPRTGAGERLQLTPKDLPAGSIEPVGGYESELPEIDRLPEELDPDPCRAGVGDLPGIVIGAGLKQRLGVHLDDCVQVTSPTIGYSYAKDGFRPPVAKQFKVIGVFEAGFDQYDSKLVYTDLHQAQAFYQGGDTVTGVEMKIADIDRAEEITAEVEQLLNNRLYRVLDWQELNHGLFTALRIQQILMSLVLALIILVAAFTVIATLIMVVLDKKKEIAVIKAMGARDGHLLGAFLYQGLIIGCVGAVLGLSIGYSVCHWILAYGFPLDPKVYFISHLPVRFRPWEFALTGCFAIAACLIATVWPAMHAARLRPAEAFREV